MTAGPGASLVLPTLLRPILSQVSGNYMKKYFQIEHQIRILIKIDLRQIRELSMTIAQI